MVHVDLENLLLGQQAFDLQRKQHLVDLASKCFLGRQIEIARDLHRDRRRALGAARLAEVGQPGANHADVVDAAVLVEARVLGRQHRVLHHLRDLRDRHEVAPLLAELAEQHAVGREDAHRQLRPVVGEAADLGQVRDRTTASAMPATSTTATTAATRRGRTARATMRSRPSPSTAAASAARPLRAARPLVVALDSLMHCLQSRRRIIETEPFGRSTRGLPTGDRTVTRIRTAPEPSSATAFQPRLCV